MAVASTRVISITLSGDITASAAFPAAGNAASPGQVELRALTTGANTITPPTGTKSVTIAPLSGNTVAITLKGVSGDTGILLHKTDPTSIGLDGLTTFVINVASGINVRLFWA